jgi:PAS domain S-box-containing protein
MLAILGSVFLIEALIMLVLDRIPEIPRYYEVFIDTAMLTLLAFPLLYFFMVQPMRRYISQTQLAEQETRQAGEQLESLFANPYLTLAMLDMQFNVLRANQAYTALYDLSPKDLSGRPLFELFHEPALEPELRQAASRGEPLVRYAEPVHHLPQPSGEPRYWDVKLLPIKDASGSITRYLFSLYERTPHIQAEKELEEKRRDYKELINTIDGIVWEADAATLQFTFVSDQAQRLLGCPAECWSENPTFWVDHLHPEDRLWAVSYCQRLTAQLQDHEFEYRFMTDDGDIVWLRDLVHVVVEDGAAVKLRGIMIDITRQKESEAEIERLLQAEQASRHRAETLSRQLVEVQEAERRYIARELHDEAGQALTSMLFGLRMLEIEGQGRQGVLKGISELKKTADQVLNSLHRLAIDLRPASLEHLGLAPALDAYITHVSSHYGLKVQFRRNGIDGAHLKPDDETALYRIVQEALTNVVRHSRAERVSILLECRDEKIRLVIEDDGVGFEPHKVEEDVHLGLFGMRERAAMLGGSLEIESFPGKGTALYLEVPYVDADRDCG